MTQIKACTKYPRICSRAHPDHSVVRLSLHVLDLARWLLTPYKHHYADTPVHVDGDMMLLVLHALHSAITILLWSLPACNPSQEHDKSLFGLQSAITASSMSRTITVQAQQTAGQLTGTEVNVTGCLHGVHHCNLTCVETRRRRVMKPGFAIAWAVAKCVLWLKNSGNKAYTMLCIAAEL